MLCGPGAHLVVGRAEEVIAGGVEAQPRHRALMGPHHLHA